MSDAHQREAALFDAALELPSEQRRAYLDQACSGDATLRRRVESLLKAGESRCEFLDSPTDPALRQTFEITVPPTEKPGDRIGRYKLLEQIGEGGCGVVYVAEQTDPVRRPVALKIVKLGMDTKSVIVRFEAERQALALMDHPNIAKVFDAGATETGRPYFVMELVRGIKITDYCDAKKLSPALRLDLFIQVCHAIQHAHQKGVIHRDIKPSNILVTVNDGVAVPKIIDFGIAKATSGQLLTDKTIYTAFEQFIGTPAYMSPEQAVLTSLDIDTRSDIYALGVLLYELLTGKTPFESKELLKIGLDEMRRTIREAEPPRPSTRVSTLRSQELSTTAHRRGLEAPKLVSELHGDLDWIVMKCLEKDRARRYETANGLALDLERYLNHQPVSAAAPTPGYRLAKFIRRHRAGLAVAVSLIGLLAAGAVTSTWQAIQATKARRDEAAARWRAEQGEQKARASELAARRSLYAMDMNLAQIALKADDRQRAATLIERNRPQPGQPDLRGWEWRYLWQLCQTDELVTVGGHSNVVSSVAISPDGKKVLSASYDGDIKIWDLATGRLAESRDHPPMVFCLAISPDGRLFASGGYKSVIVWKTASPERVAVLKQDRFVRAACFSPAGRRLAWYTVDGVITLWDVETRSEMACFPGEKLSGSLRGALTFSPDGMRLAIGGWSGNIYLLEAATGREHARLTGHSKSVSALAFAPDGQSLVSCGWDCTVRLWDLTTSRPTAVLTGHTAWVSALALSPDAQTLATASADQSVGLWKLPAGTNIAKLQGHWGEVWAVAFTPDGRELVTGGKDGAVKIWSAQPKAPPRLEAPPQTRLLKFSADSQTFAVVSSNSQVFLGEARTMGLTAPLAEEITPVVYLQFSPTTPLLATGHRDGSVRLWDAPRRRETGRLGPHQGAVSYLHFSADGTSLCSLDTNRVFKQWDLATLRERATGHLPPFHVAEFSPDHAKVALSNERDLRLLDLPTGGELAACQGHLYSIDGLAFSPDGRFLASAGEDGSVRIWDVASGQAKVALLAHRNGALEVAYAPDGGRLMTRGGEGLVRLWDTTLWQEVLSFPMRGYVEAVFFSPDGHTLVTTSSSKPSQLWRAPSFEEIDAAEQGSSGRR